MPEAMTILVRQTLWKSRWWRRVVEKKDEPKKTNKKEPASPEGSGPMCKRNNTVASDASFTILPVIVFKNALSLF